MARRSVCGTKANPVPCPDNFIPLVAGEPTAGQIYFDGATPGVPVTGFGVKLLSDGSPSAEIFPASTDSINVPSPPERDQPGHSVNLLIPAQASRSLWKMDVSIFEKPATGVGQAAVKRVDLTFRTTGPGSDPRRSDALQGPRSRRAAADDGRFLGDG